MLTIISLLCFAVCVLADGSYNGLLNGGNNDYIGSQTYPGHYVQTYQPQNDWYSYQFNNGNGGAPYSFYDYNDFNFGGGAAAASAASGVGGSAAAAAAAAGRGGAAAAAAAAGRRRFDFPYFNNFNNFDWGSYPTIYPTQYPISYQQRFRGVRRGFSNGRFGVGSRRFGRAKVY